MALELLRKAETLTEDGDKYRAVTYNNFACIFRRTKKLRSALSYLEKALEIEYNYLHYSEESVDDCLQVLNPTDIHLNICAILSQMGKHELAHCALRGRPILDEPEALPASVGANQRFDHSGIDQIFRLHERPIAML